MLRAAAPQILIVDDNIQDVALFRTILERGGYSVTDFNSGRLGVQAIQEIGFDLVILDLNMPDMDGFQVLRAIRHQTPKPKVLVVSGFMQGQLLDAASALGAVAVMDKSVAPDQLLASVGKLLESETERRSASWCRKPSKPPIRSAESSDLRKKEFRDDTPVVAEAFRRES